jgi:phosphoenolpyruvate carboxykinase (ATP)
MPLQSATLKQVLLADNDATLNEVPFAMENDLNKLGIKNLGPVYANLSPAQLYEEAVVRKEVELTADGAVVAKTGSHTGRSPNDKYVVRDETTADTIDWGKVNQPYEPDSFNALKKRITEWLNGKELFVQDLYAGADEAHRLPIRIITTCAWHNLFARNMFIRPTAEQLAKGHEPAFTVLHVPEFQTEPTIDKTRSGTFVMLNFAQKLAMIGGTSYAGEIKKTIFTVMNYVLHFADARVGKHW